MKYLSKLQDLDEGVGGQSVALKNQLVMLQHQVEDFKEEMSVLKKEVCGLKQLMDSNNIAMWHGNKAFVLAVCVGVMLGITLVSVCK